MTIPDRVRLPVSFDAELLALDVEALAPSDWIPHFNTSYYQGDWSGVPLRSIGGRSDRLYPDPAAAEPYADTDVLLRCAHIRGALAMLRCELTSVRLLRLGPGARVREHRDYRLSHDDGELRLHVPVTTGPHADFVLAGTPVHMTAGECWYIDVTSPHRVTNDGWSERVHLVIDALVNDWLTATLSHGVQRA
ncbi:MAG: aspartyl/asparaginyl beta-hydroxylase domain-containing protein [Frankiaceae bacterium]